MPVVKSTWKNAWIDKQSAGYAEVRKHASSGVRKMLGREGATGSRIFEPRDDKDTAILVIIKAAKVLIVTHDHGNAYSIAVYLQVLTP